MTPAPIDDIELLRKQIAAAAARLVAQDGADYGSAKRKAARQLLGKEQPGAHVLPDNARIEEEVRLYQALFHAGTQPARLAHLRATAVQVMEALAPFSPYLTGSVLNGTAGEHDDIRLQLFADSAKEVEIFLLNKNVALDFSQAPHFKGPRYAPVDVVSFLWRKEGVHAELYELDDLRGALKPRADGRLLRADTQFVRSLLDEATPVCLSRE